MYFSSTFATKALNLLDLDTSLRKSCLKIMNNFLSTLTSKRILLSDGAMGTELQRRGLKVGDCPEEYNLTHPEIIQAIHKDYYDAGSDIVETNTFGANQIRLKFYGLEKKVREINTAAVQNAKVVCPNNKFIAGSIGPLGELFEPIRQYFRKLCI